MRRAALPRRLAAVAAATTPPAMNVFFALANAPPHPAMPVATSAPPLPAPTPARSPTSTAVATVAAAAAPGAHASAPGAAAAPPPTFPRRHIPFTVSAILLVSATLLHRA
mmetsp:Transcript_119891/g.255854  ORF Transcript_119891/g.255854 Transcript_119891/m.255854 type:complete len:110 (+) Transcript_119891:154-483(+)